MNQLNRMDINEFELNNYPTFARFIKTVFTKSPMQKRYLAHHFAKRDTTFFERSEKFAAGFVGYLDEIGLTIDQAVDAYLEVCADMLTNQMRFKKTHYRIQRGGVVRGTPPLRAATIQLVAPRILRSCIPRCTLAVGHPGRRSYSMSRPAPERYFGSRTIPDIAATNHNRQPSTPHRQPNDRRQSSHQLAPARLPSTQYLQ